MNQFDVSGSCMPVRCRRTGKKNWQCSLMASPGKIYCDKHRLERDMYNEKRRNNPSCRRKNGFSLDSLLHSDQRQCRLLGLGGCCSGIALPGNLYCEKHKLQLDLNAVGPSYLRGNEMSNLLGVEGAENQTQNVVEGLRGQPEGSAKRSKTGSSVSWALDMSVGWKASENKSTTGMKKYILALPSYIEEHRTPSLFPKRIDSSVLEDNGGRRYATGNSVLSNPTIVEDRSGSINEDCAINDNPTLVEKNCTQMSSTEMSSHAANMLGSARLTDSIRRAWLDDMRRMFEKQLNTLDKLGKPGSSVHPACSQVEKMLKIINYITELDDKLKTTKMEAIEKDRQFDEIQKSITRLNAQLQELLAEREMKSLEIVELQKETEDTEEKMDGAILDLHGVIAAPK